MNTKQEEPKHDVFKDGYFNLDIPKHYNFASGFSAYPPRCPTEAQVEREIVTKYVSIPSVRR